MVLAAALHFVGQAQQAGQAVVVTSWVELLTITSILAIASAWWHKHNCHEHHCLRLSWHPDEDGHPVCKKHHPDHPSRGLWWAIKHFFKTGEFGDQSHPRHAKNKEASHTGVSVLRDDVDKDEPVAL